MLHLDITSGLLLCRKFEVCSWSCPFFYGGKMASIEGEKCPTLHFLTVLSAPCGYTVVAVQCILPFFSVWTHLCSLIPNCRSKWFETQHLITVMSIFLMKYSIMQQGKNLASYLYFIQQMLYVRYSLYDVQLYQLILSMNSQCMNWAAAVWIPAECGCPSLM